MCCHLLAYLMIPQVLNFALNASCVVLVFAAWNVFLYHPHRRYYVAARPLCKLNTYILRPVDHQTLRTLDTARMMAI